MFDALVNKRSYKPAFGKEQVRTILHKENGRIFDPAIADILLDNIDEFFNIYHQYKH